MAPRALWSAEKLNLSIGRQTIFEDASLSIGEAERLALVGRNGSGKTTLLRIVSGEEKPSSGSISTARALRIAALPQEVPSMGERSAGEILREGIRCFEEWLSRFETLPAHAPERAALEQQINWHSAWTPENKCEKIASLLGLPDPESPFDRLSGGERRRVLLARAVVSEPDLLLLDEPTNHLDVTSISWIEKFLAEYRGTCLFVTHDRFFLDRIATRIVELEHGKFTSYEGSYADFLAAKAARNYAADVEADKRAHFLRREIEWVRRSPKARLKRNLGRIKRFEELSAIAAPVHETDVELLLPHPARLGNLVVQAKRISLSLGGKPLLRDFSCELTSQDKIGIIGPNGAGKTTLLKLLSGQLAPDSGSVRIADTVEFNCIDQHRLTLDPEATVREEIGGEGDFVDLGGERINVWGYLKRFLFEDERIKTQVKFLSGGEKARLLLAKILKQGGNVLMLDEPTNDLDLPTIRVLEESLIQYPSTLVVVSHDRYFLNRVCNRIFALEGGGSVSVVLGDYDAYEARRNAAAEKILPAPRKTETARRPPSPAPAKKLSYKEEKELGSMESRIGELEERIAALEAEFGAPDFFAKHGKEAPGMQKELEDLRRKTEELYARWEELEKKKRQFLQG